MQNKKEKSCPDEKSQLQVNKSETSGTESSIRTESNRSRFSRTSKIKKSKKEMSKNKK